MALLPRLWRFVLTDLDGNTVSMLDRLASDRKVAHVLADAAVCEGTVPSDSNLINTIWDGDLDPLLAPRSRLLYGLRRDGVLDSSPPGTFWSCRFAGIIALLEDEGDANSPKTHFTAYDPWEELMHRPILTAGGHLPSNGLRVSGRIDEIAVDLLSRTHLEHGNTRIDFGQTGEYGGTIEELDTIEKHFDPGTTVGEAWQQLLELQEDAGILLQPIFDPLRPGYLCEFNIYNSVGSAKPAAIFGWDKASRGLVGISRLRDGVKLANKVLGYAQDGQPATVQTHAGSVAKYGEYWLEKFYSSDYPPAVVNALAQTELRIRKYGGLSFTLDPAPERAPDPYTDYYLGDSVPIYATNRLRYPVTVDPDSRLRIDGLPILISDDGVESVDKLLLSFPIE